jgi:serine/threonine protein kinase
VKSIDFLALRYNILKPEIKLIDFDQCFPIRLKPEKMLGTPISFMAPEVAIGHAPGPASDVWALGCCILRLRSGEEPFSSPFDVNTPEDLVTFIAHTIGDIPEKWQKDLLWDSEGRPTKDTSKGRPHDQWWEGEPRSLRDMVYNIWDEPEGGVMDTGILRTERGSRKRDHVPLPPLFSDLAWNPKAVKVDNVYITGYGESLDELLPVLPKIAKDEAELLYDLLAKIFVYEPDDRPSAMKVFKHPWFKYGEGVKGLAE